jgi:hypothetical protein
MMHRDRVLMAFNHEELGRCPVQMSSRSEFASLGPLADRTTTLQY